MNNREVLFIGYRKLPAKDWKRVFADAAGKMDYEEKEYIERGKSALQGHSKGIGEVAASEILMKLGLFLNSVSGRNQG